MIAEVLREEQAFLLAVPAMFDGFVEHSKLVSSTCLLTFERNRYSVPASFANRVVSLHASADRLVVVVVALASSFGRFASVKKLRMTASSNTLFNAALCVSIVL